jgi:hypothetical protein
VLKAILYRFGSNYRQQLEKRERKKAEKRKKARMRIPISKSRKRARQIASREHRPPGTGN